MDEMKKYALASVDANAEIYNKISDSIWDDPELSLKEHHAAALYCEALEKLGFTVEKGICGIETAFSGSYGAGHPVIGILGEFDALSGLSQKCGETSPRPRCRRRERPRLRAQYAGRGLPRGGRRRQGVS